VTTPKDNLPQVLIDPDTLTEDLIRAADGLFLGLLRNELVAIYIIQDDRFRFVNPRFAQLFGYTREELCGHMGPIDLTAPEFRALAQLEIERRVHNVTGSSRYSFDGLRKDGSRIRVEVFGTRAELDGRPAIIGMMIDNTDRHRAELEVKEHLHFTEQLIDAIPNPIFYKDEHGRYLGCNGAFEKYLGKTRQELLGKSVYDLSPKDLADRYHAADKALFDNPGVQTYEANVQAADGERKDVVFYKATFNKSDGSLGGLVGVILDITERKRSEEAIWREANYDALTQLPNRRLFIDRLQHEVIKTQRSGKLLALMFIDLDRFKEVNDTLGHETGDLLLAEAARRIIGCVRRSDTVARLGGDEFTVILPDIVDPPHLENTANAILQALQAPFQLKTDEVFISASIGLTFYPHDADDIDTLLINADQAMYDAKAQGRNRFSHFRPAMQTAILERLQLGNELRTAIQRRQFELYYQPILDLASGRIVKAEALLRWNHPQRGLMNPDQFIPVAEDLGLISQIGDWVFRQTVALAKRLGKQSGRGADCRDAMVQISVNKSPRQFFTGNTHETWVDMLQQEGLPSECIGIEITESLLMDERPEVLEKLLQFRDAGIQVSLDDFGTGYSAMGYLKRFHIDYLKIDHSFVRDMANDPGDRAIIEAIIAMAHKLGIKTIAEGIENEEQRALLAEAGCDYGQGYLFSRPLREKDFVELLLREGKA
jgi:diguanylate cyclase (GGDEF)-like protein/PAS domain S-box-containing protein